MLSTNEGPTILTTGNETKNSVMQVFRAMSRFAPAKRSCCIRQSGAGLSKGLRACRPTEFNRQRSFAGAKDISSSPRKGRFSRSYRLTATSLPQSATPVTHGNQPMKYTKWRC